VRTRPELLQKLAEDFFNLVPLDDHRWGAFHRFREAILFELGPDTLAGIAIEAFDAAEAGSGRQLFLYEVALSLSFEIGPPNGVEMFERLYLRADSDQALGAARDDMVVTRLPANYYAGRTQATRNRDNRQRQQQEFDQNNEQIRSGAHLGWLKHLS
jgi:hypothetical protein